MLPSNATSWPVRPSTPSGAWLSVSSDTPTGAAEAIVPAVPAAADWTRVSPPLRCQTLATTVLLPFTPIDDTISTPW